MVFMLLLLLICMCTCISGVHQLLLVNFVYMFIQSSYRLRSEIWPTQAMCGSHRVGTQTSGGWRRTQIVPEKKWSHFLMEQLQSHIFQLLPMKMTRRTVELWVCILHALYCEDLVDNMPALHGCAPQHVLKNAKSSTILSTWPIQIGIFAKVKMLLCQHTASSDCTGVCRWLQGTLRPESCARLCLLCLWCGLGYCHGFK